ncbi:MAG TPA: S9 family peptidase [Chitinophagaceae bacterium]|jgi:dipeptidyl aminopeptidase/acylaminoacyl peptidase|nr:S9 family peptidase [Chitinophagaceae bacterium]
MRFTKTIFSIAFLAVAVTTQAQTSSLPPIIDRELFFGPPVIAGGQLSPDGKYMSFLKVYKGTMNVWVKDASAPFESAHPLTSDTLRPIRSYFWSRDGKYILYVQDKGGDENFNVYAVNPSEKPVAGQDIPTNRALTDFKGVRTFIYSVPKSDPDALYIGLNDRDKKWHDLYKLKISTGEKTLLRQNSDTDRITGWIFDWSDKLRLATRANEDGSNDLLRVDEKELVPIYHTGPFEEFDTYAFDKDNKQYYIATNKGDDRDLKQLVLLDPVSMKETFVEKDPMNRVDFGGANFSDVKKNIILTSYTDEKERLYWKDREFEADYKIIEKELPGLLLNFTSSTADENLWLLTAYSDIDPGAAYLFDRKTKKLAFQYRPRPDIPTKSLAPMKAIKYKSSDGLEIPAYLVLPKGVPAKNLPMVAFPHGGPWGRDVWGYNSFAQFLANRGYAVLLPNFRASTGYGKKFLDAGNRQWGDKMQDDITWGIKYLISEGIVDAKHVGIMGGSYGGYATLAGVAFTPDLYAAAVSIVGPSNLITLLNSIPPYWESIRKLFYLRMGDPTTDEGKKQLERQSPLNSADKIKTPLLVAQGANDPRVNKAESEQIVNALRKRNFPVEYILAPDEGHGFARPVNNMAMLAEAEKFLATYLGGRYQETMTAEVEKRLGEIKVDTKKAF